MSPTMALRLLQALELGLAIDQARAMFQASEAAGEKDVSGKIEEWMNAKLTEAKNA